MKKLLLTLFFYLPLLTNPQEISFTLNDPSLKEIISEIESQTDFKFAYGEDVDISLQLKGVYNFDKKELDEVLVQISKRTPYILRILGSNIAVSVDSPVERSVIKESKTQFIVEGNVTDSNGMPLPGVSVMEEGTTNGVVTDFDGNFSVEVSTAESVLVFTYIGMTTIRRVVGDDSVMNIEMEADLESLDEVVVTALGIKRSEKTLGYSTVTLEDEAVSENRTTSTLGALQGKASGVNITSLGTGPQGSTKIQIRGSASFTGDDSPLIVVNGVPFNNTHFGGSGLNNSDGGDGLSSINPDNIETMTILKGAAAAALYGSRAKAGVIMITTKDGVLGEGLGIEYNINTTFSQALDFTDFQYEYGQGEGGVRPTAPWPTSGVWSFGERFEPGMTQILFDGVEVPYEPVRDRIDKFYRTGTNVTQNLALSYGSETGNMRVSFENTDNISILPNSDYNRKSINLGFSQKIFEDLTVQGNLNYSNEYNQNPAQVGGQEFAVPSSLMTVANSMPLDLLHEYAWDEEGNELVWNRFLPRTNPYFSAYKHFENIYRDRYVGNISLRYDFTDWLYLQGRIAQDHYVRNQDYNYPTGYAAIGPAPAGFVNGSYFRNKIQFRERNYDFLLGMNRSIGEDLGINVTLGGNQMYRRVEENSMEGQDFIERGLYTIMNSRVKSPSYSLAERKINSLYGAVEFSYQDLFFLNLTGRNDWFSTLAPENRSIFYPSATASFVFTDAFDNLPSWITFGKLRAGYAEVGDDNVDPYSNALYYSVNNALYPTPSGSTTPIGGINASTIPNGNLRPLSIKEYEAGIDLRLFNNRVGFDFSVYRKYSEDQIVSAQVSNATGYNTILINVGRSMNEGFESAIRFSPVRTESFRWDLNANASYNTSEVLQIGLNPDDTEITVGGVRQVVGKPMGQIYEYMYKRDEQGRIIFNEDSGFPVRTDNMVNVGRNNPSWFGGITNSLSYKGFTFSALIDFKLGKDYVISGGSNRNYWRHGLHKGTLPGRNEGYVIGDGVNPDGGTNTTPADVQPYYESISGQFIVEEYLFNAGFWKLRQLSLGYDLSRILPEDHLLQEVRLSLISNNVATLKKWTENMDPEEIYGFSSNTTGSGWSSLPITRNTGFNLKVRF